MPSPDSYRAVAEDAWTWTMSQVREADGPWLPEWVGDVPADDPSAERDTLYAGIAGLAPMVAELRLSRALTEREAVLADAIVERLSVASSQRTDPSLYDGLAGDAMALRLLAPGAEAAVMARLLARREPDGWPSAALDEPDATVVYHDVISGTAGIVLTACWVGGEPADSIATTGAEALLRAADATEAGLDWKMCAGRETRMPNFSHGTAGVATALAIAGRVLDRPDFLTAARHGAQHLLAVGSLEDGGLTVPQVIPSRSADTEPFAYGWCHGSAGTSQLFAALGDVEVDGVPAAQLRQCSLASILRSEVPQRTRPGFWDNDGRCCGTAGVGDVLLDAAQDADDPAIAAELLAAARRMADAIMTRAIRDEAGARWRFVEHRNDPPLLPPNTSWMQGAAGIAAFLMRLSRLLDDGLEAPVVDRPDQWWAVPDRLRTSGLEPAESRERP